MKYFYLYLIVILFSSFGFSIGTSNGNSACPSYLDHDLRILDSQNYENLCKYKDKVIMVVNVASSVVLHINTKACRNYMPNTTTRILLS